MSTRIPRSPAPRHRPASGVYPLAPCPSFLVLVTDPAFGNWIADEARPHGETTVAATVASALAHKPRAGHWTAALLDVCLTDGSGFTALDGLRRVDTDLPVLFFADAGDLSLCNRAFRNHAALLNKPIPPGHLQMFLQSPVVRTHGREWRARRARAAHRSGFQAALLEITEIWRERYNLTWTEADVMHLALHGLKRADIADRRAVPENKIKSQVNRLLSKTECASLAELATEAMYEFLFDTRRAPAKKPTLIRRPPGRPDE